MIAQQAPGTLDRFVLEEQLGSSAVADVFAARDEWSARRVVLKQAKLPRHPAIIREHAVLARLGASLGDMVPEIVTDGIAERLPWFATAFIEGGNLRDLKQKLWPDVDASPGATSRRSPTPQQLDAVVQVALRFAVALARLHSAGVVHADLRPENVLLGLHGQLVLIDFEGASSSFPDSGGAAAWRRVTPGYSAPEALLDLAVDCRADLYSWACIVRELLVGQAVFSGATNQALARLHIEARPKAAVEVAGGVPQWLDTVLLGLLEKEPWRRRTTACQLVWKLAEATRRLDVWHDLDGLRPPANRPRFVGRHAELRRLDERLEAAARGAGGVALVCGGTGTGKSAVLDECAQRARALGFRVLHDRGLASLPESVRGAPEEPPLVRLLLAAWLEQRSSEGSAASLELPGDLRPFASESAARFVCAAAAPDALPPDASRRRAFRALAGVAQEISVRQPLLVLLDDALWAEEFSLAFLVGAEARALGASRALLVASVGSSASSPPPFDSSAGLGPERIELGGLDRSSTAQLVNEIIGTEGEGADFSLLLHERCEGNPLLVGEAVRWAMESGQLHFEPERGWSFPAPEAFDGLPVVTLDGALELRLARLDEEAARVAALAAVVGRRFGADELSLLAPELASTPDAALRRLVASVVLAPFGEGFAFVQENVRRACEQRLGAHERRQLHALRAEQLAQSAAHDAQTARRVGQHWLSAGQPEHAARWLLEAASQLDATLQPFGVISDLRLALDRLRAAGPLDAPFAGTLLALAKSLLDLYGRTGQHEPLRALANQLTASGCEDWRARCRASIHLARSLRITGEYAPAARAIDQAERCWRSEKQRGKDERLWLELQDERVWLLYMSRDVHAIGPALQRMAPVVRRHGTASQQASFYMLSANDLVLRNQYQFSPSAVAQERYALGLLKGPDALPQLALLEFDLAFQLLLGALDHCSEAVEHLSRAHSLAERLCDPVLAVRASTYLAIAERRIGRIVACQDAARRALEGASLTGTRGYAGAAHACLGWVAWRRDDVATALRCFAEARSAWWHRRQGGVRSRQEFPFQWLAELPLLSIHASRDDFPTARGAVDELLAETQQRLPAALHDPLSRLQRDWERLSERELDRQISDLTLRAAETGHI